MNPHVREQFPFLQNEQAPIYLDSAATAQKPACVIDAITRFYQEEYGTVHRAVYGLCREATMRYAAVREKARAFLGASSTDEILFTKGTTDAINLVASSYGKAFVKPGDEIVISEMEHHSNIVPWQMLCQERGARLKVIPINDRGELLLDAYAALLSERTKLVSVAHVSNVTGTINPIEEIVRLARQKGAVVFIDGAQSAPHMLIDVQKLGVDFFAFSGHKAYGPTGVGVLYAKKRLLDLMPPYQGGGDMIEQVTLAGSTYQKGPLKFEAGTPSIASVIGLGEALDFIERIGRSHIEAWERELTHYATTRLLEIPGLRLIGTAPAKGPILTFVIDGVHHLDLGTLLDLKGISIRTGHHCAQPLMERFGIPGAARISFALYNTHQEINQCLLALQEALRLVTTR